MVTPFNLVWADGIVAEMLQVLCAHLASQFARTEGVTTVPNVIIVAKIIDYFRKTVITTVITADTQCEYVVTNRNYDGDDITFATIITFGTVLFDM